MITYFWYSEDGDLLQKTPSVAHKAGEKHSYLLLKVPAVFLINKDQVQVIPDAKLLVHIAKRRRQVKPAEEQPDGYCFSLGNIYCQNRDTSHCTHPELALRP
jgi:hypothetical protein